MRLNANMFYFIHINKTAGTSIEAALGLNTEHVTASQKIAQVGHENWSNAFTFSIVRNPWDRAVSLYHFRRATNQTGLADGHLGFIDWISACFRDRDARYLDKPMMFMPQVEWISDDSGNILVDFVGRFERLASDIKVVSKNIDQKIELPHLYKSDRTHYRGYFDDSSRDIVAQWFCRDIDEFRYEF
jgi:hypothetical protein